MAPTTCVVGMRTINTPYKMGKTGSASTRFVLQAIIGNAKGKTTSYTRINNKSRDEQSAVGYLMCLQVALAFVKNECRIKNPPKCTYPATKNYDAVVPSLPSPMTSHITFPVVLRSHTAISPIPIFRSMRHPFRGTNISKPHKVTSNVIPLMMSVVLTCSS